VKHFFNNPILYYAMNMYIHDLLSMHLIEHIYSPDMCLPKCLRSVVSGAVFNVPIYRILQRAAIDMIINTNMFILTILEELHLSLLQHFV
jgi:hypothetical protein